MESKYPVLFVLALAIAASMWAGSGIADVLTSDPTEGLDSPDELERQANESAVSNEESGGGFSGPVGTGDEDNIVGLIISGARAVASVFGMVLLLPFELINLGFPAWFALPIGLGAQTAAGIGIIQFATGRVFR